MNHPGVRGGFSKGAVGSFVVVACLFASQCRDSAGPAPARAVPSPPINAPTVSAPSPVPPPPAASDTAISAPSQQEFVVRFFALLRAREVDDALSLMDDAMIPDANARAMWKAGFDTISSVDTAQIEEYWKEEWSAVLQIYKVTLRIKLKPGEAFRGWEEGENIRFVHVGKKGEEWRVTSLGTGP